MGASKHRASFAWLCLKSESCETSLLLVPRRYTDRFCCDRPFSSRPTVQRSTKCRSTFYVKLTAPPSVVPTEREANTRRRFRLIRGKWNGCHVLDSVHTVECHRELFGNTSCAFVWKIWCGSSDALCYIRRSRNFSFYKELEAFELENIPAIKRRV